jgi:pimeloyl-ACP methyl ester carboxylesterase
MKRWIRRIALGLVGLIALVLLVGAGYEAFGRRQSARQYPAPGKLVDIGGRHMQLDCRGTGSPTVVFESGLDIGGSMSWSAVHDSIAATTRACAYSRAGIMWSEPRTTAWTAKSAAEDLHRTLRIAGERTPFVLVGHSLGGPYIMTYTKYFGEDVAGLVFVDASHPDQVARMKEVMPLSIGDALRPFKIASALSWSGAVRLISASAGNVPNEPEAASRATAAYASTSLDGMLQEAEGIDSTFAEAGTFRKLGDRPLIVLTAMAPAKPADLKTMKMTPAADERRRAIWKSLHDDEASWSTRSQHQLVPDATHYIQFDQPQVVIAAVRAVVDSVRRQTPKR